MERLRSGWLRCREYAARLSRRQLGVIALLLAIVAGGAALRLHQFVERPLWEDEAYTWQDCQVPLGRLLWWKHDPAHGPASHLLVRLSMGVFGTDAPWAMRLPSLVCGLLCIPAAFWLGRTIHGDLLGLAAALLVAVDPNMVDQSQQARMYTMLALATLLALAQALRLLADPPESRRPWIVLGLLLAAQFWINFGAAALWLGLALAAAAIIARELRGADPQRARSAMRGLATAYGVAILLSSRGLWRMYIFVVSDRGIAKAGVDDTLQAMWRGFEQLIGNGALTALVMLGLVVGLCLLWRQSRNAALVLISVALVTTGMIFAGRGVHHMIAARYFTVMQPTLWMALASLVALASSRGLRVIGGTAVAAVVCAACWQTMHVERWVDLNTWRYARSAARFIEASRASGDLFACTPDINFGVVARYYDLVGRDDRELHQHLAERTPLPRDLQGRTAWMLAYMFDPRAEGELQRLLTAWRVQSRLGIDSAELMAAAKDKGLTIIRLSDRRFDVWVYDAQRDDFRSAASIASRTGGGVRAAASEFDRPRQ